MRKSRGEGFTLIELLIVVTIIGVLAGLIVSAMFGTKSTAHATDCRNNLKGIASIMMSYQIANNGKLLPVGTGAAGDPYWPVKMHELGQAGLVEFNTKLMRCAENLALGSEYRDSPAGINKDNFPFAYMTWVGGMRFTQLAKESSTVMFFDSTKIDGGPTIATPATTAAAVQRTAVNTWYAAAANTSQPVFRHPGKTANFAFADGSVGTLSEKDFKDPAKYVVGDPYYSIWDNCK